MKITKYLVKKKLNSQFTTGLVSNKKTMKHTKSTKPTAKGQNQLRYCSVDEHRTALIGWLVGKIN